MELRCVKFTNTTRCRVTLQPYFASWESASFRSVPVVSAVVRRPAPLGLEDALADVAVDRGVWRLLVLGRDVPQKRVLRRERDAALVAVRRVDVPDAHHRRLRRLYKCIPQFTQVSGLYVLGYRPGAIILATVKYIKRTKEPSASCRRLESSR